MTRSFVWIVAVVAMAQAPGPSQTGRAIGVLKVKVVNAVTGEPVRKALVNVNPSNYSGGPSQLQGTTDQSGQWTIAHLPVGRFMVTATHPRYPPSSTTANPRMISGTITDAKPESEVTIALPPGCSVSGKVTDVDGDPLVSNINLWRVDGNGLNLANGASTDDRGEFHFYDLPPGRYYAQARSHAVVAQPHDLMTQAELARRPRLAYVPVFHPNNASQEGATLLRLESGANLTGLDFRLTPVRTVSVSGRIVFPPGINSARQGMGVQMFSKKSGPRMQMPVSSGGVRPGGDEFTIPTAPPGEYVLRTFVHEPDRIFYVSQDVMVGDEPVTGVTLSLKSTFDVAVRVSVEPSAAPQPSLTADPQRSARPSDADTNNLWINRIDESPFPSGRVENKPEGKVFRMASPGRYTAHSANGYVKSIRLGGREITGSIFELGDTDPGPLEITVSNDWAKVQISSPASQGRVTAILLNRAGDTYRLASLLTSEQGRNLQSNLVPGEYKILCAEGGEQIQWSNPAMLEWAGRKGDSIRAEAGRDTTASCSVISMSDLERAQKEISDRSLN